MTIPTFKAAKRMCAQSQWSVSNLKLQKMLYLAHMHYMGTNDGNPLISETFQAWDYGPVVPVLYHRAKIFGVDPIERFVFSDTSDLPNNSPEARQIDDAVGQLLDYEPGQLVAATHWPKGAWAEYYQPGLRGIEIPNHAILTEFNAK